MGDRETVVGMQPSRVRRGPSLETWLLVIGILLVNVLTVKGMGRYGVVMLFAPAILALLPILALRTLSNPIPVFCGFLVIIVNLDFFRIQETRLTADILTSTMVLYMVLVRLLLAGRVRLRGSVEKTYLVYLALTFVSVVLSVSVPASIKNWGRDLEYWVFFIFLSTMDMTEGDRRAVMKAAILSTVIPCLLGLTGQIFGIDAFYGLETPIAGGEAVRRISSTLSHPVTLSHYLAFVATLSLSVLIDGTWFRRSWLLPVYVLQIVVLYLTYARTGWGEMLAAMIALFWMRKMRRTLFIVLPALGASLLVLLPTLLGRIENAFQSGDNSLIWRFSLWLYALSRFPAKPIFGSGQDTFAGYIAFDTGFAAHHTWINLLIETGIVGIIAFAVLQIVIGKSLAARRRDPAEARDPLLLGFSAGWIGMLVGSFAGDPFNLPAVSIYFWTLLALTLRGPLPPAAGLRKR